MLYLPALDASGKRVARDPRTGNLAIPALIGVYIPGSGDPINGMVVGTDKTYPAGFKEQQPVQLEPRIGFAYQVTPKLVARGGFGLFYNGFENRGKTPRHLKHSKGKSEVIPSHPLKRQIPAG